MEMFFIPNEIFIQCKYIYLITDQEHFDRTQHDTKPYDFGH